MKKKRKSMGVLGRRQRAVTPLFVRCPVCDGSGKVIEHMNQSRSCACVNGFIETGFTQERFDVLIRDNDRLLMLLETMTGMTDLYAIRALASKQIAKRGDDLDAARSRTTPAKD